MSDVRGKIWMILLLLFVTMTTAAEDDIRMGCRRGKIPAKALSRRSPVQKRSGADSCYLGDKRQLVVLVSFADRGFVGDEAETLLQWEKIFNTENFSEEPFAGSLHDYFYAQSYGQFNVTFDLQYVALADSCKKYRSTSADDENSQFLVEDIVDSLLKRNIDWSPYDWKGDGYVTQMLIVYAGKGSSYAGLGGGYDAIWPHQWWLSWHVDPSTGEYRNWRTVSSGGREYKIDCYCVLQELFRDDSYGSFGTICHEYSHCFGFPDFYYNSKILGEWDLMDFGNYNEGGFRPCGYSAHERMLMGWITPVELTSDTTVTEMAALCDKPQAYIIRNDAHPDEYYMLENRQQRGWDASLPGSGIVIFHVDYDKDIWESDFPNNDEVKRYTIFPANNNTSTTVSVLPDWPYPYDTNNELTNTSSPAATLNHVNTDSTYLMSKPITGMTVIDGRASFEFMKVPSAINQQTVSTKPKVLYEFGPIYIIRCANGEIKKVMKR